MQQLHVEHINRDFDHASLKKAVLRSLVYFDIFNYPLCINEITQFSSVPVHDLNLLQQVVDELTAKLLIFKNGDYYSIKNDAGLTERRRKGNAGAAAVRTKALKRAKLIQRFPFVRSVNISGSLSKNYFDEQTDIDFFVIAENGRIWICRLLLTAFKKLILLNRRKYFCINYFVDTQALNIPDKNIFSATEIITLRNQTGEDVYRSFMEANSWVEDLFPNHITDYVFMENEVTSIFKKLTERLFSGKAGDMLDSFAFKFTSFFLKKKYAHLRQDEFEINLRAKKHVSKHHPQGFQFRVLQAFELKCREFESKHGIQLSDG